MTHRRRTPAAAILAALIVLACAAAPATAQEPPDWLKVEDGTTQPQFDFTRAIEETVFVETELDTDRDGAADRIRIRISRPREAQERGYKVPVVFEHNPYRGDFGPINNHPVDVEQMPQEPGARERVLRGGGGDGRDAADVRAFSGPPANLPGSLDDYYVPRGYAVVLGESIGTFNSTGCPDVGASAETLGTKAVIDWLGGRARGFDAAGAPVSVGWTTGDVGMTGGSYNGTLPNQVATTGVEGLKTIIPVAAISSWYDYYRANGLVVAPHSGFNGAGTTSSRARTPTCSASSSAGRRCSRAASAASCTTTCSPTRTGSPATTARSGTRATTSAGRTGSARACSSSTGSTTSTSRRRRSPSGGTGSPMRA